ncbi:MAG: GTP cyclohydrolase II [Pseudomonadota bacterium]
MQSDPVDILSTVERAASCLRSGRPVLVEDSDGTVLTQAAETVSAEAMAAMKSMGEALPYLVITSQRATAVGLPVNGDPFVCLQLSGTDDLQTIEALADPTHQMSTPVHPTVLRQTPFGGVEAALRLTKVARLLPAALVTRVPSQIAAQPNSDQADLLRVDAAAIVGYGDLVVETLRPVAEARLPLAAAENARIIGFRPAEGSVEQFAIVVGSPAQHQPALCRIHSECFTGDLLGSLRCDCGQQLQEALRIMGEAGHGVLLYMAHEGRGIGLINKLRAYQLQDTGIDTVDANRQLGFDADERSFRDAAVMLRHLGIEQIRLLTNNPAKVRRLNEEGIVVTERVPHAMAANRHNESYLRTKAARAGHFLED